jgi:hypothetical protein
LNWIDKHQLDLFAETTGAKLKLPRLVSELILATSDIPDVLRFLADESGQVRGFDGVLVSPGAPPFVPAGKSYWEFGCEKDVRKKAREDLASRTATVDPAERAQATLVLVTPRHYDSPRQRREDFISKASAGSGWKDVWLIDGQELKHWLDMAPGVAARWARRDFQSYPPGVWSVDEFWHEYSNGFDPPLREEVLLAGRGQQADAVVARMANLQPERITICADSPNEALGFAMAALRKAKDEVRLLLDARSLVVTTPEAARDLRDKPLIYFPTGGAARSVGSLADWGPTILAKGRRDVDGNAISLRRPSGHDFAMALEQPRIPRTRAAQLATECGRSVTVLARRMPGINHPVPDWASHAAVTLLPALLAGAWDASNPHDCIVLAQLAGVADYWKWEALLQPLLLVDDPPIEYQKPIWKVRAPVDAFVILGSKLGKGEFEGLQKACILVLRELDRNLEKSGTELMMADAGVDHSDWLRDGLATTLLMISTLHDVASFGPALASHGGPEQWVGGLIAGLPGLATDGRLLASLQRALPILAEAAPLPFVQALEKFVSESPEGVAWLFTERKDFIHTRAHHTSLLWALETIAWDSKLVSRVCLLLTRLAALDPHPDSKLINRPLRSLRGILLPWLPGTDADVTVRVGLLEAIRRTCEPVAWNLSLQLLPEYHAVGEPVVRPQLREAGRYDNGVTWADAAKVYAAAAKQTLSLVGGDPDRWTALIDHLAVLSDEDQSQALRQLGDYLEGCDAELRTKLWQRSNDLFLKHAEFGDADWALRGSRLDEIGEFVRRFTPQDRVQLALPLFDDMRITRRLAADGNEVTEAELEDRRSQTVRDLLDQEGTTGLLRLAEAVRNPWLIAQPLLALLANPGATLAFCASCFERGSENARVLARAISAAAHRSFKDLWLECLSSAYLQGDRLDDFMGLLLGLSDEPQSWAFVDSLGEDVAAAFWRARRPWHVQEHGLQVRDFVAERYLKVGKPGYALSTLADTGSVSPALTFQVLAQLLDVINSGEIDDGGMLQYRVERLFTALRAHPEVDRSELANWEFAYLPLLTGPGRRGQPLELFNIMSTDPANFVEALKLLFRAKNAVPNDREEGSEAKARAAYNLLEAFRTVPGVTGTGVDGAVMARWVRTALEALAASDRLDVGLSYIGKLLAHAPSDPEDSAWPAIALRDVIESETSEQLEQGIALERFNMRGVYSKGIYDGGDEERRFASQYREWAAACVAWPRTSAMLDGIATGWDRQAEHEDIQAQQRLMKD